MVLFWKLVVWVERKWWCVVFIYIEVCCVMCWECKFVVFWKRCWVGVWRLVVEEIGGVVGECWVGRLLGFLGVFVFGGGWNDFWFFVGDGICLLIIVVFVVIGRFFLDIYIWGMYKLFFINCLDFFFNLGKVVFWVVLGLVGLYCNYNILVKKLFLCLCFVCKFCFLNDCWGKFVFWGN